MPANAGFVPLASLPALTTKLSPQATIKFGLKKPTTSPPPYRWRTAGSNDEALATSNHHRRTKEPRPRTAGVPAGSDDDALTTSNHHVRRKEPNHIPIYSHRAPSTISALVDRPARKSQQSRQRYKPESPLAHPAIFV